MNVKENSRMISVIVTTYNRKELLKETLDSILAQTYTNFELIVVDNYSNYDFFEHIESFNDDRIRAFQNANDGIIAVNRNYGIKKAKGEYLAFCDDDDLWKQDKLEKQVKVLINTDIIAVGSNTKPIGYTKMYRKKKVLKNGKLSFRDVLAGKSTALSSLVVRKTDIKFNESSHFLYVEDFLFQLEILREGLLYILDEPLVEYRYHKANSSTQGINALRVINIYEKYFKEKVIDYNDLCEYKKMSYLNVGIKLLRAGDKDSTKWLIKSLSYRNISISLKAIFLIFFSILPKKVGSYFMILSYKIINRN